MKPLKIRKFTEEHKRKISERMMGHKLSEETKRKMSERASERMIGHIVSEETKLKMSKAVQGPRNPNWKGGVTFNREGYALLYRPEHPYAIPSGYVTESRLVMEEKLGRYLKPEEVVHHKNGDILDNRLENLRVMMNDEHSRLHGLRRRN